MKRFLVAFSISISLSVLIFFSSCSSQEIETNELNEEARSQAPGSFVDLSLGKVHYELKGEADAQTIVLIHGYSVPYYIWDNTFYSLAEAGFRVLRYDLYGRGYSDRPDVEYSQDLYDTQLAELLDALDITEPVDFAGISMGGPIAVTFADRRPEKVRKIILVDTEFSSGGMLYPYNLPIIGEWLMMKQAPSMADGQSGDFYKPENFPHWSDRYKPQMRFKGFLRALLSTTRYFSAADMTDEFERVGKQEREILIIWGKEDPNIPVIVGEMVQQALPESELVIIEDAGHIPTYERPDAVNPVLIEFLKK